MFVQIFQLLGTPNEQIWPGYKKLPHAQNFQFVSQPYSYLKTQFGVQLPESGLDLLGSLLTYDPDKRITAADALKHSYFRESPKPKHPSMFPSWPSSAEGKKRKASPLAPMHEEQDDDEALKQSLFSQASTVTGPGFRLRI